MLDPTLSIQSALIQAISSSLVLLNSVPAPVYAYAPAGTPTPYILVDQVSVIPGIGARACSVWEPIFQLTVVTSFQNVGSDEPSLLIQNQLVDLLHEQPLALGDDFVMSTLRVDLTRKSSQFDNKLLYVMRYIRLKMRVLKDKK